MRRAKQERNGGRAAFIATDESERIKMVNDFFLTEWFFYLVRWLYSVLGNSYFLTILIVTLVLRAVQIFPDIKSRKSQRQQAALQPEIEKLQ